MESFVGILSRSSRAMRVLGLYALVLVLDNLYHVYYAPQIENSAQGERNKQLGRARNHGVIEYILEEWGGIYTTTDEKGGIREKGGILRRKVG